MIKSNLYIKYAQRNQRRNRSSSLCVLVSEKASPRSFVSQALIPEVDLPGVQLLVENPLGGVWALRKAAVGLSRLSALNVEEGQQKSPLKALLCRSEEPGTVADYSR